MNSGGGDGGQSRRLVEVSAAVAGAEIGRDNLGLHIVLDEEPDRDAAVRSVVPDLIEPLPGRHGLSAVDPFYQDEGWGVERVHAASTSFEVQ